MSKRGGTPSSTAAVEPSRNRIRGAAQTRLLDWFEVHRRDLPWRRRRTPYRVWISELMLQQTRVDTVVPYYRRFMRSFPSLRALANASERDLLKAWEGLGYYRRIRMARQTAHVILTEHGGRFPRDPARLRALPGIGPYTAAAVASLAFGIPAPVVDGNVIRVVSRWFGLDRRADDPALKREVEARSAELIPADRPGAYNEAVMELGATVCTPRRPDCPACPMHTVCRARASGTPEAFPAPKRRTRPPVRHVGAGVVVGKDGRILIAQRKAESMLGGLWEFPGGGVEAGETLPACIARELKEELGIEVEVGEELITVVHAFSHFTMHLHAYMVRHRRGRPRALHCADWAWVRPEEISAYPLPRADQKILACLIASGPDYS